MFIRRDVNCTTGGTANNGNIWGITDTIKAANNQGFTYDSLNRIGSFSLGGVLNQQYTIDSFGNMSGVVNGSAISTFNPATNQVNNLPCASSTTPYDAAGNQLCTTNPNGAVYQYAYDAESRISQIAMLGNAASPFEAYIYGADGARVRKANGGGNFTEYVDFNGQTLAEKDQTGTWTDYIYADGERIARAGGEDNRIHTHGVFTASGNELRWNLPYPTAPSGSAYTVKAGDVICWRQYNDGGGIGGPAFWFSNNAWSPWAMTDTSGVYINQWSTQNVWATRCADLTWGGRTTGAQMTPIVALLTDVNTPAGTWDIWYADMAITSADGTVTQVIGSQPPAPAYGDFQGGAWTGTPTGVAESVPLTSDPTATNGSQNLASTHFYLSDHLGTAQLEFAAGGYAVWAGQFAPYGGELDTQISTNHYKFTGKERDTESGLDYFGARYYASSLGRWMSPDWASKAMPVPYASLDNPQSLNLYSYVGNNPLSKTDADGHCSSPSVQGGHVGICLESYIQMARFGFLNLGHGDNRGPVGNDPSATYRTQTMIDVNIGAQSATEHSTAGLSVTDIRSKPGVVHDWISDTQKGADGSTTFTVHVYGENGEEAAGNKLAPGGWIEMTFTLKVAADGTVSVVADSTKKFPSISIYSYQPDGSTTNVFQQKESGDVNDLNKPSQPGNGGSNVGVCPAWKQSC